MEIGHLLGHIVSISINWRLSSADDSSKGSLHLIRGTLATHNEESEDDQSPQQPYDNELDKTSGVWHRLDSASMVSQHKNMVDLIQVIV